MISAFLFLATLTGLGLRLARWIGDLPDKQIDTIRTITQPPGRAV